MSYNENLSFLIDRDVLYIFAETAKASDYLRSFCASMGITTEFGHGNGAEYKDFTVAYCRVDILPESYKKLLCL